jgi:hypothetical protein
MYDEKVSERFLWRCFLSLVVVGAAAPSVASTAGFFSVGVLDAGFFDDIERSEAFSAIVANGGVSIYSLDFSAILFCGFWRRREILEMTSF